MRTEFNNYFKLNRNNNYSNERPTCWSNKVSFWPTILFFLEKLKVYIWTKITKDD